MLKRTVSLFVLSIFLLHFAGFYIYFFVQLKHIQQEMRNVLKKTASDRLEVITLSKSTYQKAKIDAREIKVDGKMYDVARIEKKNDTVLVYCLQDKAENNLIAFINKTIKLPLRDKKVPPQLLRFISLFFILPSVHINPAHGVASIKGLTEYSSYSTPIFLFLDSPPPRT